MSESAGHTRQQIERQFDALFDRVMAMNDTDLRLLRSAWDTADSGARIAAWRKVRAVIEASSRDDLMADARATLARWADQLSAAPFEFGPFMTKPPTGMEPTGVRREAIPPVMDALAAVVAADGLDPEERELLMGPVDSVRAAPGP